MWNDDDDSLNDFSIGAPSFEEDVMLEEASYMRTRDIEDFFWAFHGWSLKDHVRCVTDFYDFNSLVTLFEDTRPLVTDVYDTLRKHYEEEEEYEKCQRCLNISRELRAQLLKLQTHYEKVDKQHKKRSKEILKG